MNSALAESLATQHGEKFSEEIAWMRKAVAITNRLRLVLRDIRVPGREHQENDLEHTGQLLFSNWHFVKTFQRNGLLPEDLDVTLVLIFTLIHDFVEVYAGDTSIFRAPSYMQRTKQERERAALEVLSTEWTAAFPEFIDAIVEYEQQKRIESRLVRALDKLLSVFNVWEDGGRSLKEQDISYERYRRVMFDKIRDAISGDPRLGFILDFSEEIFGDLQRKPELFAPPVSFE